MTTPSKTVPPPGAAVLRGVMLRPQTVSPGGRPKSRILELSDAGADHGGPVVPLRPMTGSQSAGLPVWQRTQEDAWKLGFEEGHKEGVAAARTEVLASSRGVVDEAIRQAVLEASQQATIRVEKEVRLQWQGLRAKLDKLITALPEQVAARLNAAEDDMLALCMDAVVNVLGQAAGRPEQVRAALEQALGRLQSRPLVSIELHADDLAALQGLEDWTDWATRHVPGVQWVGSDRVAGGGCVLHAPHGSLDARLEVQLQSFKTLLLASAQVAGTNSVAGEPQP